MKTIFLDSNIFLHFKMFTEIDWIEICKSQKCKLVIAPIVIDELDKYKIGNDERSKRARKILKKFEEFVESQTIEIRKDVEIEVIAERPNKNIFRLHHLSPEENDNQLIASVIDYRKRKKEKEVYLCSYDIGPRLRAKPFGIEIIKLPNNYLLPKKENTLEKQLMELSKENVLLRSRIPKPLLLFENKKDFIKIKITESKLESNNSFAEQLLRIKADYPYKNMDGIDRKNSNPFGASGILNKVTNEQIKKYNSELDIFYLEYADYLKSLHEYEINNNLSIKINLFLTNHGNVPCKDVDIYCRFPDGFEIIEEEELEEPPEKPNPPSQPMSLYESISNMNFTPRIPDLRSPELPKLNRPSIKKTNSYEVHFFRESVKHCTQYKLDMLIARYKRFSDIKNFAIEYTIIAGNVPEPVTGALNIIFDK